MTAQTNDSRFGTADLIVDAQGLSRGATHTTITAALADASSGDNIFIRPGTYTENFSMVAGVNLIAYATDSENPTVSIVGTITAAYTGSASISGIRLTTNSANFLTMSGANSTNLFLINCYLNASNNTGISVSNANAVLEVQHSWSDIGTTGIALFTQSAGVIRFEYCQLENSGNSTTANTISGGACKLERTQIRNPITTSSTAVLNLRYTQFFTPSINATCLTCGGSGNHDCFFGIFTSGTAVAITVNDNLKLTQSNVNSSNGTAAIDGSGTLEYGNISFTDLTQNSITTSTVQKYIMNTGGISFDEGTNVIDQYEAGSWTPTLTGSAVAPDSITYSVQTGRYTRIGNMVFAACTVSVATFTLGSGSGQLRLEGFPLTASNIANFTPVTAVIISNATFTASGNMITGQIVPNSTSMAFIESSSGSATSALPLSSIGVGTSIRINLAYRTG